MTGLLNEVGKKVAERWLSTLLLPGLLFAAAAVCAYLLGHEDALDLKRLVATLDQHGQGLHKRPAAIALTLVAFLLAATGAGIAAERLGDSVIQRLLACVGPRWWLLKRRRAARAYARAAGQKVPPRYLPARATPIGDRFRLLGERVDAQYGLDAALVWPRLWLILDDPSRAAVMASHRRYRSATTNCGWGVLYLVLASWWWPAALISGFVMLMSCLRASESSASLTDLIEASIDVNQLKLADAVGIPLPHGRITPTEGHVISDILNKRA
ncbi:hypothetical protein ABZ541_00205 [Micromonospora sediminicola]|uniref:hypothetical protein n=1 Tax=Micromonospora sediminicola TaxID=946078 RepID=UPI0033F3BFEF